ncbi:branched-chain amino acid ABC transporter substrate-binding protein [Pararhizobium sp.]|uniref:branched-chain amino acid ABC transporter substrate-binding protein n=1 Tax=Pararhizobium sp. TaxID=1977563 RepID=UPI002726ACD5|nr:branched-chain amino acid ABC transporter substrate-binding protein [Pararhizobium sp.]MDO9415027.1 branched-chain amino acid ABC transporter substrate-binding protein [Pararhizobium sp.]
MKKSLLSAVALTAMIAFSGNAWADIIIGIGGPMTGPNAAFGAQLQKGAEQAAADFNAAGGINGEQIKLVIGDDASEPQQGVSVANKFVADGAQFVVGHFNSGVTMPASEIYRENGVLAVTPAATNVCVTARKDGPCGDWKEAAPDLLMFRTCGNDLYQGTFAGKYILDNYAGKNIVVLHDKTAYGQGLADQTKKTINEGGLKDVIYEGVTVGEEDFSALVSKIKEAKADLVYWGGLHTEAARIVKQMREQGVEAKFMSADGITSDEYAAIGGDATEGTLMTFPPDPRTNPASAAIVKKFVDAGFNPEAYTLYGYAAMQVIKEGIEKAGGTDTAKVAEYLYSGATIPTVVGEIQYDKVGDKLDQTYVMYTWKKGTDGKITYVPM